MCRDVILLGEIQYDNLKNLPIARKRAIPPKDEILANANCKHTIYRDYTTDPVEFSGRDSPQVRSFFQHTSDTLDPMSIPLR
jgi:hypothetical protein